MKTIKSVSLMPIPIAEQKREPLSAQTLKNLKGYENLTPEEAMEIFDSLTQLALILYEFVGNQAANKTICIDNQLVVNSQSESREETKIVSLPQIIKKKAA